MHRTLTAHQAESSCGDGGRSSTGSGRELDALNARKSEEVERARGRERLRGGLSASLLFSSLRGVEDLVRLMKGRPGDAARFRGVGGSSTSPPPDVDEMKSDRVLRWRSLPARLLGLDDGALEEASLASVEADLSMSLLMLDDSVSMLRRTESDGSCILSCTCTRVSEAHFDQSDLMRAQEEPQSRARDMPAEAAVNGHSTLLSAR